MYICVYLCIFVYICVYECIFVYRCVYLCIYVYIHNEIARRAVEQFPAGGSARSAGRPAGAAWAPRARPGRPCWLDLASIGSLWLPLAPLLARFGLVWLDLAALAGSIWLLCALLGAPAGSIWLPTTTPSTRLAKTKNDLLIDDPAPMLPASCALERFFMPQI